MPYTEHVSCQFHLTGQPDHPLLQIEFTNRVLSALANPTRRVFFAFRKSVAWDDAETLVAELNKKVRYMAVTQCALGEDM
jgi:hypothetical protein